MVFPLAIYVCESWTIKKAEHWRMDAFELWCWRRLLRVPGTARRSNQSILKEISPEYSLERLILNLKLQYFGYVMWRTDSLERTLMLDWATLKTGGVGDDRGWDGWMASLTWWTWVWVSSGIWWWTGKPGVLQSMGSQRRLNRMEYIYIYIYIYISGFPQWLSSKESAYSAGASGFNSWVGGNGNPLQYSCLENPWTEEPGRLQSMWSQRVGHDWSDLACMHPYIYFYQALFLYRLL